MMYRKWVAVMQRTARIYRTLEAVSIPNDVPELGIQAGDCGVVDRVYDQGRRVHVEAIRDDETVGFVTIEPDPEPHVIAYYRVS